MGVIQTLRKLMKLSSTRLQINAMVVCFSLTSLSALLIITDSTEAGAALAGSMGWIVQSIIREKNGEENHA